MTYFVSFYRTATLGSGAGVSALVYLNEYGVKTSEAFGMYMIEYAVHKLSIVIIPVATNPIPIYASYSAKVSFI